MSEIDPAQLVPYVTGGAFVLAFIFGAVGNKTHFCTMGAVSDWVNIGDTGRMRAWVFSMAVALVGVIALEGLGRYDRGLVGDLGLIKLCSRLLGRRAEAEERPQLRWLFSIGGAALLTLVREMNRHTRFVAMPLGSPGNAPGSATEPTLSSL